MALCLRMWPFSGELNIASQVILDFVVSVVVLDFLNFVVIGRGLFFGEKKRQYPY